MTARARHLTPAEIPSTLGSHLQLLTRGTRNIPARHRTLREAFPVYWCIVEFGALAAAQNAPERTARMFGAARAFRDAVSVRLSDAHDAELQIEIAVARTGLDPETWDRAWAEGYALTPEEAAAQASSVPAFRAGR